MNTPNTTDGSYSAANEVTLVKARRSVLQNIWRTLKTAPPTAWFGMVVITLYLIVALFAPLLAPHGQAQVFPMAYAPWSEEFRLGTDALGRDVFSRLIYGARNTIGIAVATTLLAFLIGGSLGLIAAISRNWLDQVLSRFVDVLMAIPSLIFALMLLSIFGSSAINLIFIIAVLDATRVFRLTRAVALNVVVMDYVEAAKLRGEGLRLDHAPGNTTQHYAALGGRVWSALLFCVFNHCGTVVFRRGDSTPTADWGSMVRENAGLIQFAEYDLTAALTPMIPAAAIALLTVAVNFVVDWFLHQTSGLRDEH